MELIYDAGALVAADRCNSDFMALHTRAVSRGIVPRVPAGALGQVWRDGPRQARLMLVLKASEVIPLDETTAKRAGALCARAGTADVIDASVVVLAAKLDAAIVTSDHGDIAKLVSALGPGTVPEIFDI